ncbi:MAG: ABC transporter permease [Deltaproteobacteria bacterium]|nr:ABC transporter permease [Deltaproteobacteria bacterium]
MSVVSVVFGKELRDALRDRRAILSLLVFPFVGPALVAGMLSTLVERATSERQVRLPIVGAERAPGLVRHLEAQGIVALPPAADPVGTVRRGEAEAVLVIPEAYGEALRAGRTAHVELVLDDAREVAQPSLRKIKSAIAVYGRTVGTLRLLARGLSPELVEAVAVDAVDLSTPEARGAALLHFVPMFVLLAAFVGGMHLASDATAGERERGSLEPLLLTPASRRGLAFGKWLAAFVFASVTVVLTMTATMLSLSRVPLQKFGMASSFSLERALLMLACVVPLAALVTATQVLFASFARTVKEAQVYLSLMMFVPMLPALFLALSPVRTTLVVAATPVLGQQAMLASLLRGEAVEPLAFALSASLSFALAGLVVTLTARLFRSERIVFGR